MAGLPIQHHQHHHRLPLPLFFLLPLLLLLLPRPCTSYTLGDCPAYSSTSITADPTTQLCDCLPGWEGPECRVCQNTAACAANAPGSESRAASSFPMSFYCDRSMAVVNDVSGFCHLASSDIAKLLGGEGWVTAQMQRTGDAMLEFLKQDLGTTRWTSMFACTGHGCSQERDPSTGVTLTTCPGATCKVLVALNYAAGTHMLCDDGAALCMLLADVIPQVGKKDFSLRCANATDCTVHESLLDFYFKGAQLDRCSFGECVPSGMTSDAAIASLGPMELGTDERTEETYKKVTYAIVGFLGVLILVVTVLSLLAYSYLHDYHVYAMMTTTTDHMQKQRQGGDGSSSSSGAGGAEKQGGGTSLSFRDVCYTLKGGKAILRGVTGRAAAGEVLAIMGPSGSGKSTLMDILSLKSKSGKVQGQLYVNGQPVRSSFKRAIGFVDQHDTLLPTMTVMESLLFSALLRLPTTLTLKDKIYRVLTVLSELQLTHIADSRIGSHEHKRGISGGEKRRVSVGMELVTRPRALFLDEPTSGLDTYNADLLVAILTDLAQKRRSAVVMTIHQPRQNIFARFDRLLLMCKGGAVFYGPAKEVHSYFSSIGRPIPQHYNPADYLIDVLFIHGSDDDDSKDDDGAMLQASSSPLALVEKEEYGAATVDDVIVADDHHHDEESGNYSAGGCGDPALAPSSTTTINITPAVVVGTCRRRRAPPGCSSSSSSLAELYAVSDLARRAKEQVEADMLLAGGRTTRKSSSSAAGCVEGEEEGEEGRGGGDGLLLAPRQQHTSLRAVLEAASKEEEGKWWWGWWRGCSSNSTDRPEYTAGVPWVVEVVVVSQRMLKDMMRRPGLTLTHAGASAYFGVFVGVLYYHLTLSGIAAVQNRLGLFMLQCMFLAFTSVSALPLFWLERPLYIHERSNRYYGPSSYFISKIFSDMIPLRVLPPLLLASITHAMAGLRPGWSPFLHYCLTLVLLSVTAAGLNLIIGMLTRAIMSAILCATILMIHCLVLTTIFINFDTMKLSAMHFLRYVSFFNYGYEALVVNELYERHIHSFPITSGTVVLKTLGFHVDHLYHNLLVLCIYFLATIMVAYLVLRLLVKERR